MLDKIKDPTLFNNIRNYFSLFRNLIILFIIYIILLFQKLLFYIIL